MGVIHCLRVNKHTAGRSFPFDRLYLTTYEQQPLIAKVWRFALVMPVAGALKDMLKKVVIEQTKAHTMSKTDNRGTELPAPQRDDDGNPINDDSPLMKLLNSEEHLLCVIPMRGRIHREKIQKKALDGSVTEVEIEENVPNYIAATGFYRSKRRRELLLSEETSPFVKYTYLHTPIEDVQPACLACPRYIQHQNGECQLGEAVCLENLPLGAKTWFKDALNVPPPSKNIKEAPLLDEAARLEAEEARARRERGQLKQKEE